VHTFGDLGKAKEPVKKKSKYMRNYWLTTEDISFVLCAFLGDSKSMAQNSETLLLRLREELDNVRRSRVRLNHSELLIVNVGSHWVNAVVTRNSRTHKPQGLDLFDPMTHVRYIASVAKSAKKILPVRTFAQGLQTCGWRCGYFACYTQLCQEALVKAGLLGAIQATDFAPPAGWEKVIWALLRARDRQLEVRAGDGMNIQVKRVLKAARDNGIFNTLECHAMIKKHMEILDAVEVVEPPHAPRVLPKERTSSRRSERIMTGGQVFWHVRARIYCVCV
jgi:hypothetical protein